MKPEEAKPRDLDDLFEEGWKFKVGRIDGAGWFTAKETAEIAEAYHDDYTAWVRCIDPNETKAKLERLSQWVALFKEWSK